MQFCSSRNDTLLVLAFWAVVFGSVATGTEASSYRGRTVGGWVESLASEDVSERWYATLALARIGRDASEAVEPLVGLVEDRSQYEYVRAGAAFALGRIQAQPERVVPALVGALGSELASGAAQFSASDWAFWTGGPICHWTDALRSRARRPDLSDRFGGSPLASGEA